MNHLPSPVHLGSDALIGCLGKGAVEHVWDWLYLVLNNSIEYEKK